MLDAYANLPKTHRQARRADADAPEGQVWTEGQTWAAEQCRSTNPRAYLRPFDLYLRAVREQFAAEGGGDFLSKADASAMWRELPELEKQVFVDESAVLKEEAEARFALFMVAQDRRPKRAAASAGASSRHSGSDSGGSTAPPEQTSTREGDSHRRAKKRKAGEERNSPSDASSPKKKFLSSSGLS